MRTARAARGRAPHSRGVPPLRGRVPARRPRDPRSSPRRRKALLACSIPNLPGALAGRGKAVGTGSKTDTGGTLRSA